MKKSASKRKQARGRHGKNGQVACWSNTSPEPPERGRAVGFRKASSPLMLPPPWHRTRRTGSRLVETDSLSPSAPRLS